MKDSTAEAERFMHRTPDSDVLAELLAGARAQAGALLDSSVRGSRYLTTAELRVLEFLPTHLSFPEIAARLHVTTNTVRTQAHATYRSSTRALAPKPSTMRVLRLLEAEPTG